MEYLNGTFYWVQFHGESEAEVAKCKWHPNGFYFLITGDENVYYEDKHLIVIKEVEIN